MSFMKISLYVFKKILCQEEHGRQWVWEGLNSALAKLSKHVGKTIKDLETMKVKTTFQHIDVLLQWKTETITAELEGKLSFFFQ